MQKLSPLEFANVSVVQLNPKQCVEYLIQLMLVVLTRKKNPLHTEGVAVEYKITKV